MRLTALALAALLLAGCAQPPAQPQGTPAPAPVLAHYSVPVGINLSAQDAMVCPPLFVCNNGGTEVLLELRGNETATRFRLEAVVSNFPGAADEVHVEVRCEGVPVCREPLAQQDGKGPMVLESDVRLPPGTVLTVGAQSLDTSPDPVGFFSPRVTVRGAVAVEAVPGPPPRLVATALHLHGISGNCVLTVEENCTSWPNGSMWYLPVNGTVRTLNLTATWAATSPASQTMRIFIYCYDSASCPPSLAAEGPSPLRLDAAPAGVVAGATLQIELQWVSPAQPPGTQVAGVPLRQPFTIDGTLLTVVEADA
jgi:hypothetical protein